MWTHLFGMGIVPGVCLRVVHVHTHFDVSQAVADLLTEPAHTHSKHSCMLGHPCCHHGMPATLHLGGEIHRGAIGGMGDEGC